MVTLIILDGFGINKKAFGNAILAAGTPNLDKLIQKYPHTTLKASGTAVGLPEGQMGNSEVGHLTLGAGRVIPQDLLKIDQEIESGRFVSNPALQKALAYAETNQSSLHIIGLLSDGGVHSHIQHLYAILDAASKRNISHVYIHAFMDGRDTGTHAGKDFLQTLEAKIQHTNASIASICGRVYAMDREKRYDRLQKAYDMLINGKGQIEKNAIEAIEKSYRNGMSDEFVLPTLLNPKATIQDHDSVIFFNYRADRARELTDAITNPTFSAFPTKQLEILFSPMEEYAEQFKALNTFYPPVEVTDNLAALIAKAGKKQYHIAETTKYAHVTFFFNGGIEKENTGETRKLIESIDTQDYSHYPKMRALEITENTLDAIASCKFDFILVNYSNPDMIGHTGNFEATKEAIAFVEKQAYALALATIMAGGDCIITADHGNAEYMIDEKGNAVTSHTTNLVPFILASENHKKTRLQKNGTLANVAPTVLQLLNITIPSSMHASLFPN